jgi:hypothetical protein
MKSHLLKHFETAATHHVELGKVHQRLSEAHRAIAGHLGDGEAADGHRDLSRAHRDAVLLHTDQAEHCVKIYKALEAAPDVMPSVGHVIDRGQGDLDGPEKAARGSHWNPNAIMPTNVHGVLPTEELRLIGRDGTEISKGTEGVPAEFRHLVES